MATLTPTILGLPGVFPVGGGEKQLGVLLWSVSLQCSSLVLLVGSCQALTDSYQMRNIYICISRNKFYVNKMKHLQRIVRDYSLIVSENITEHPNVCLFGDVSSHCNQSSLCEC